MKAITLHQPWATLVALGVKQIETRSWSTNYRGPLAIHASTHVAGRCGTRTALGRWEVERDLSGYLLRGPISHPYRLPLGAVIAVVNLFQIRPTNSLECCPDGESRALGDFSPGRFAWYLSSVSPVKPISVRGWQGLWNWEPPEGLATQLRYPLLGGSQSLFAEVET